MKVAYIEASADELALLGKIADSFGTGLGAALKFLGNVKEEEPLAPLPD